VQDLLANREATHGSCLARTRILYDMKELYHCQRMGFDPLLLNSLDLILDKVSRIIAGDETFQDHWTDISGYARLAENHILNHDTSVKQMKLMESRGI